MDPLYADFRDRYHERERRVEVFLTTQVAMLRIPRAVREIAR